MERLTLLYSKREIADRVEALARQITSDYAGRELVVVGVLKGAWVFLADLVRSLSLPVVVDFVGTSSYGLGSESRQRITLTKELHLPVEGKDVLVVEDILDTGLSLDFVLKYLRGRGAASVRLCALIDKAERRLVQVTPDYVAFRLEKGFVVGYGIDYADRYRNLPDIHLVEFDNERSGAS